MHTLGHAASVPLYVGRHCVRCWQRTDDVGEPAPQVDTEEQLEILIAAGFSLAMIWKHFPGLRRFIHFDKD